jgi:hypothetical protein
VAEKVAGMVVKIASIGIKSRALQSHGNLLVHVSDGPLDKMPAAFDDRAGDPSQQAKIPIVVIVIDETAATE